jgi:hypothetical protein
MIFIQPPWSIAISILKERSGSSILVPSNCSRQKRALRSDSSSFRGGFLYKENEKEVDGGEESREGERTIDYLEE